MSRTGSFWLVIACLALLLSPVILIEYPPLVDYPNHLARLAVLTRPDDPDLAGAFKIQWALLPNLGFDVVGYLLAQIMPIYDAGRVFLALVIAVFLTSLIAMHAALYGRFSALPLIGGPLIFGFPFQMGFLSFLLGIGLAIHAFALWLVVRRRGWVASFLVLLAANIVLFVCHLFGVAVLSVLVGLCAASIAWGEAKGTLAMKGSAALFALLRVAPAFLVPALFLMLSKTGGAGDGFAFFAMSAKLYAITKLYMFIASMGIDPAFHRVLITVLALSPIAIARLYGVRAMHPYVVWPVVFLVLLYWPMPSRVLSSWLVDWRLLLPAALVAVAAAESPPFRRKAHLAVAAFALILNGAAAAHAWALWRPGDRILGEMRGVLTELPTGSVMIPYIPNFAMNLELKAPSLMHIATLATVEKAALVPTIFAFEGQQPIQIRSPIYRIEKNEDWLYWMNLEMSREQDLGRFMDGETYVLEIRTGNSAAHQGAFPLPATPVAESERFTLYRLEPAGG